MSTAGCHSLSQLLQAHAAGCHSLSHLLQAKQAVTPSHIVKQFTFYRFVSGGMGDTRTACLPTEVCDFILFNKLELQYSKTCLKRSLKRNTKIGFQDRLSFNAGQKYCRMLQGSILQYFQPSLSYHLSFVYF